MKLFLIWVSYLSAIGYSLLDAVWINMDETPMKYQMAPKKGMMAKPRGWMYIGVYVYLCVSLYV